MKSQYNPVSSQIANAAQVETEAYIKKVLLKKTVRAYILVILGSILYSLGVVWILQLGGFFSSGVTGVSQIIVRFPEIWGGKPLNGILGILIGVINVPLVILGWKGVSKRYAALTVTSIVVQTVATTVIENFTVTPFVDLLTGGGEGLIEAFQNGMLNVFNMSADKIERINLFKEQIFLPGNTGIRIVLAVIGGGITGFSAAICCTHN